MRETVRQGIAVARSRRSLRALLALVALAGALLVASGYLLAKRTMDSCTAALKVRNAIELVLIDAQRRVNSAPPETQQEQQRREATDFYRRSIARLRAVSCN